MERCARDINRTALDNPPAGEVGGIEEKKNGELSMGENYFYDIRCIDHPFLSVYTYEKCIHMHTRCMYRRAYVYVASCNIICFAGIAHRCVVVVISATAPKCRVLITAV